MKYLAKLKPLGPPDPIARQLFMTEPWLHSCIVLEGRGYLWLNGMPDEAFIRCNWHDDKSAAARRLPQLNLALDLDETLIFNAAAPRSEVKHVVRDPPHMIAANDGPFLRPQVFCHNVSPRKHSTRGRGWGLKRVQMPAGRRAVWRQVWSQQADAVHPSTRS